MGTFLATIGSLYIVLATDLEDSKHEKAVEALGGHCDCAHHHELMMNQDGDHPTSSDGGSLRVREHMPPLMPGFSVDLLPVLSHGTTGKQRDAKQSGTAGRRKFRDIMIRLNEKTGAMAIRNDDEAFQLGPANAFPEIPGEKERNPELQQIRERYNEIASPSLRPARSRSESVRSEGEVSALDIEEPGSPEPAIVRGTRSRSSSAVPRLQGSQGDMFSVRPRPDFSTTPTRGSLDSKSRGASGSPIRKDTLEVPSEFRGHHPSHRRETSPHFRTRSASGGSGGHEIPKIIMTTEPESLPGSPELKSPEP